MISLDAIRKQKQGILKIARSYGAEDVRVFGSVVRGTMTSDSDVDFLVRLTPGRTVLDIVAIKQDIEELLGCKVDVVTEASLSPYLRDDVFKEAVGL
jgi:predicted nucleotidyltransferase